MTQGNAPINDADDDVELDVGRVSTEPLLDSGTVVDGKYILQRSLGRGGTSTVYEAQHVAIGHRVALKIVNADRAQRPETLARFQREAQICGALRHPNVGQIHDVGTYDGRPYMVLELHEGQSLANVLDESILPLPAILEITLQVLSALAAVHAAGIVHRDVKPDNAMLVRALNGDIVVKLVDFGISKLVTADIRERTLTREGSILGSPDYMAPEQLRGYEVDARTDLYAVGVLLYEAVAGRTPFDAENLSDLMAAILRDTVEPPSELRSDCPPELDALIVKALSREPDDRFQSAGEMARQVEQVRAGLHHTPGAGIAELRKPMPPRSQRVTRARRAVRGLGAPETVPSVLARNDRKLSIGMLAGICVVALLGIAGGVTLLRAPADSSPHSPQVAAPTAQPPRTAAVAMKPIAKLAPEPTPAAAAPSIEDVLVPRSEDVEQAPSGQLERRPKAKRVSKNDERDPVAVKPAPEAPSVREQLAEASSAFVLGQMPRAKALYQQILDRAPSQPDAWRGLGLASNRMGQHKDAKRAFERYLELRPGAPDAVRIREQLDKLP